MFDVALVGTGGMLPLPNRYLSSMIARYEGSMVLIDCGEGAQVSLKLLGWGFKAIDCICLTHFHADHVAGLPGLLLTIGGAGRDAPLTIIGPKGLAHIVNSLCVIAPEIPYDLEFIELAPQGVYQMPIPRTKLYLSATPAEHNCPCYAYCIDVKRAGMFDMAAATALGLPKPLWGLLQRGQEVSHEGRLYSPNQVMGDERKGLKVSYITDSRPPRHLPPFIKGSDLFICEGHYGDNALLSKAKGHKHMLFSEAAKLAKEGQVKELWLTHYSPAMQEPQYFIKSATSIFANTKVGFDRMSMSLVFDD